MNNFGGEVGTDVDKLVSFVKEKGKVSFHELVKHLKKNSDIIQKWVDFLVEEDILGIEYKFVTPYVYFNKDSENKKTVIEESDDKSIEDKNEFYRKAKSKGLSDSKIHELWKDYVNNNLDEIKRVFYAKAKTKNLSESQCEKLWEKYYDYLLKED